MNLSHYDHVLGCEVRLLTFFVILHLAALIELLLLPEFSVFEFYIMAWALGFLYAPNSFLYMILSRLNGEEGDMVSLGKAILFELTRVARRAIKRSENPRYKEFFVNNQLPPLSSLQNIRLNLFGRKQKIKQIKLTIYPYTIRLLHRGKYTAYVVLCSLFLVGSLPLLYLLFPDTHEQATQFLFGLLVTVVGGVFWTIWKLGLIMWALHGCERRNRCPNCHKLVVDALSFSIYNDMTLK